MVGPLRDMATILGAVHIGMPLVSFPKWLRVVSKGHLSMHYRIVRE